MIPNHCPKPVLRLLALFCCAVGMWPAVASSQVVITAPQSPQAFNPGENLRIEWQVEPPATPINLAYSADAGQSWEIIAVDQRGNSFDWTVPLDLTTSFQIRAAIVAGADPNSVRIIAHDRGSIRCVRFNDDGDRLLATLRRMVSSKSIIAWMERTWRLLRRPVRRD